MPEILITNAYSSRNKGDAGIIAGMIDDLRSRDVFSDATFTIASAAGPVAGECYPGTVVDAYPSLKRRLSSSAVTRQLGFLFFLLPQSLVWIAACRILGIDLPVWSPLRRMLRAYSKADLVIAAGGGYLYTRSPRRGNVILLSQIYSYHCAVLLGKPVYLWSQSIGPFAARFQERLVARSLRRVRLVLAREAETLQRLEEWQEQRKMAAVDRAADAAFLLTDTTPPGRLPPPPAGGIRVGLTVRRWWRDPVRQERYERVFGRFAGWLAEEMDAEVFFVPQVTWTDGSDDDRSAARATRAWAGESTRIHRIEDELDPAAIRGLCGAMDLFVGTRMHSNIYALSMNVPALAVGYQPKTAGIMKQLGLERFVLPIDGLRLEELQDCFRRMRAEREDIAVGLAERIPQLREDARRASRLIEENFNRLQTTEEP